ncbi:MAG: hypothetical protein H6Q89_1433 [Myxococcaceae bacterium]|nr:hypothetical protein [Myxococcaceae bacterium]
MPVLRSGKIEVLSLAHVREWGRRGGMKRVDLIGLTEACYRLDLDLRSWMRLLAGLMSPELDHGVGVVGWLMRFPSEFQVEPVGPAIVVDGPSDLGPQTQAMNSNLPPQAVRGIWFSGQPLAYGSEMPGMESAFRLGVIEEHRAMPSIDGLGFKALDGEGFAISFAGPSQHVRTTTAADRARWRRIAPHLAAGFRLRRRLDGARELESGAEAIFTPEGRCLDARGSATTADARELLRSAVRSVERSRGPLRRKDPEQALGVWKGLVTGRWSLVDSFTSDQKRYVVARQNAPSLRDPRALSERERQVVAFAASGEHNKLIAYRLGLATSSVATHLANASRKLKIRSRSELARLHAVNNSAAEVRKLEVGGEALAALVLPVNEARFDRAQVTQAEREVAEGILEGASNAQIASRRKTSVRTVANQVASILRKFAVGSRTELVARLASAVDR